MIKGIKKKVLIDLFVLLQKAPGVPTQHDAGPVRCSGEIHEGCILFQPS